LPPELALGVGGRRILPLLAGQGRSFPVRGGLRIPFTPCRWALRGQGACGFLEVGEDAPAASHPQVSGSERRIWRSTTTGTTTTEPAGIPPSCTPERGRIASQLSFAILTKVC